MFSCLPCKVFSRVIQKIRVEPRVNVVFRYLIEQETAGRGWVSRSREGSVTSSLAPPRRLTPSASGSPSNV
jgi:hypothetical protein